MVQMSDAKLTKSGIHLTGMTEYEIMSTRGQNPTPANQAPGKSSLILVNHLENVNSLDWINPTAKKMQVNEGPKISCPSTAFSNVEIKPVPGKSVEAKH